MAAGKRNLKVVRNEEGGRAREGRGRNEEGRSQDGWVPKAGIQGVSTARTHMGTRYVGTVWSELHSSDLLISCLESIPLWALFSN